MWTRYKIVNTCVLISDYLSALSLFLLAAVHILPFKYSVPINHATHVTVSQGDENRQASSHLIPALGSCTFCAMRGTCLPPLALARKCSRHTALTWGSEVGWCGTSVPEQMSREASQCVGGVWKEAVENACAYTAYCGIWLFFKSFCFGGGWSFVTDGGACGMVAGRRMHGPNLCRLIELLKLPVLICFKTHFK